MKTKLVIGTRGSELALRQTDITREAMLSVDPQLKIEVRVIKTKGDTNHTPIPLDTIGKGWFTEEIERALYIKEIDLAVHSLKDMAEEMPEGLIIGAYLPREDARDTLVTKNGESLDALPEGAIIGTDSTRRQVQMLELRPDVRMQSVRGAVPTRLEKLAIENYSAVILAAAGLKRLGLEGRITRYFEPNEMTPAPGQGILAVQARKDDVQLHELLSAIQDKDSEHAALIERSFSQATGGGCKSPNGAYASRIGSRWTLCGMIQKKDGTILRDSMSVSLDEMTELGPRLAKILLSSAS